MPPVLGLPDLVLESIDHIDNIYINAVLRSKPQCPRCNGGHIHVKDSFSREINHSKAWQPKRDRQVSVTQVRL